MTEYVIVLFYRDLRIKNNLALHQALEEGKSILPLFIHDTKSKAFRPLGENQEQWLRSSLNHLAEHLSSLGLTLVTKVGDTREILQKIVEEYPGAQHIHLNRAYEPSDTFHEELFKTLSTPYTLHRGALLFQPWEVKPKSSNFCKVFTPFWKTCLKLGVEEAELSRDPRGMQGGSPSWSQKESEELPALQVNPKTLQGWSPGEAGAQQRLQEFLQEQLAEYASLRDHPGEDITSRLSPHLRFGEIAPISIYKAVQAFMRGKDDPFLHKCADKFLAELGWREFSYHILHHYPAITDEPYQEKFKHFPWEENTQALEAWKNGLTGFPIVDAGMRELIHTGTMHNRVRMLVASFLIKDLFIHWKEGELWFWNKLFDADPANNPASWQWVAGSGFDAAPYFRVFNPVLQGEKFDKEGTYIKRWVPELSKLPNKFIHKPWLASKEVLEYARVDLGENYPLPLVDHADMREKALSLFSALGQKEQGS